MTEDSIEKAVLLNEAEVKAGACSTLEEELISRSPFEIWRMMRIGAMDIANGKLMKKCMDESKKTWEIAAPAILTSVAQFSLSFVTAAFVGHLGAVELAAVSIVDNVLEGFVYGIMVSGIAQYCCIS